MNKREIYILNVCKLLYLKAYTKVYKHLKSIFHILSYTKIYKMETKKIHRVKYTEQLPVMLTKEEMEDLKDWLKK